MKTIASKSKMRLAYSTLTDNVFVGKMREKKCNGRAILTYTGEKHDVTQDFLFAMIKMIGKTGNTEILVGMDAYKITATKVNTAGALEG